MRAIQQIVTALRELLEEEQPSQSRDVLQLTAVQHALIDLVRLRVGKKARSW